MGHHSCCNKQKVRRGLWSPEEDEKLINYISTYGHGCWSSVPRLAGLQRCGKSCRLRWINYLRPDLKRGSFSPQEESLIIELHRILGNRWAQIAKHLPGRTDNEVKNFWNSSIKKKLLSHGGAPKLIPAELSNQVSHSGDLLPLSANPNLMATSQDLVFLTSATPMSHGFGNEDLKTDVINNSVDWINAPPPLQPSVYASTWALDHDHHHQQHHNFHEDDYQCLAANGKEVAPLMPYDPAAALTMPQLGEMVDSHEVNIDARLPYFPSGSYPYDLYVAMNNQMDYMDAVITSSSSLLSCGNFPINPNLPPN